jgi:hypothetical protein
MTPERVLQHRPLVLDQRARERYFEDGFLTVPGYVGPAWLDRLRAVVATKIEESRALTASDDQFDLAPDHSAAKPNIRRLRKAVDQHPELWAFAQDPIAVDLVADLLGPDVRFHSSKLNFKWSDGGDAVRWHQDIPAWPHTSFSVLTFGVYLDDTSSDQGPLTALPGTHRGPLFDHFDDGGHWTGALSARDLACRCDRKGRPVRTGARPQQLPDQPRNRRGHIERFEALVRRSLWAGRARPACRRNRRSPATCE